MLVGVMDYKVDMDADTAGVLTFGAWFGWCIAHHWGFVLRMSPWVVQVAVSLFTMVAGAVVLHFLRRELRRRWPDEPRKDKEETKTQ